MKRTYSGTSGEIGDSFTWDSNVRDAGKRRAKLLEIVPGERIKTSIHFIKPNEGQATSNITLTPEGAQTKVTWDMDTEMNYPMNLMKLFMDGFMDDAYGRGLKSLKRNQRTVKDRIIIIKPSQISVRVLFIFHRIFPIDLR